MLIDRELYESGIDLEAAVQGPRCARSRARTRSRSSATASPTRWWRPQGRPADRRASATASTFVASDILGDRGSTHAGVPVRSRTTTSRPASTRTASARPARSTERRARLPRSCSSSSSWSEIELGGLQPLHAEGDRTSRPTVPSSTPCAACIDRNERQDRPRRAGSAFEKELRGVKPRVIHRVPRARRCTPAMIGEVPARGPRARSRPRSSTGERVPLPQPDHRGGTVVVAVSQSGETADTLAALLEAKDRGALALGVINVVGSTMARETDAGVYLRAWARRSASRATKAFTEPGVRC